MMRTTISIEEFNDLLPAFVLPGNRIWFTIAEDRYEFRIQGTDSNETGQALECGEMDAEPKCSRVAMRNRAALFLRLAESHTEALIREKRLSLSSCRTGKPMVEERKA